LKKSRKMITKLKHDASSRATATATIAGFMAAISRSTGRRPGTASRTVMPHRTSTTIVSARRRTLRSLIAGGRVFLRGSCRPRAFTSGVMGVLVALISTSAGGEPSYWLARSTGGAGTALAISSATDHLRSGCVRATGEDGSSAAV
jgi:hypothetical protein